MAFSVDNRGHVEIGGREQAMEKDHSKGILQVISVRVRIQIYVDAQREDRGHAFTYCCCLPGIKAMQEVSMGQRVHFFRLVHRTFVMSEFPSLNGTFVFRFALVLAKVSCFLDHPHEDFHGCLRESLRPSFP